LADNEELLNERMRLEQSVSGVRQDNDKLCSNVKELELNNDGVKRKVEDL
jgi:hypothetical protein